MGGLFVAVVEGHHGQDDDLFLRSCLAADRKFGDEQPRNWNENNVFMPRPLQIPLSVAG
jgi:hypothetical protein